MKQRISALLLCGMLTICGLDLTGCMPADVYETEHFRFSVSDSWELCHARYDEDSQKNKYLRFMLAQQDFEIHERTCDLPLTDLSEDGEPGSVFKELPQCKYPAWETIFTSSHVDLLDEEKLVEVTIVANGYFLTVRSWFHDNTIARFEETLPRFLESIELTAEQPQNNSAAHSKTFGKLHAEWSDDWHIFQTEDDYYDMLNLQPAAPQNNAERLTILKLRRVEEIPMENVLARDGLETETFVQSAKEVDNIIPTVGGLEFIGGTRYAVKFKESGNSLVEYNYYFAQDNKYYVISMTCDGTCEEKMLGQLAGFSVTITE